MAPSVPWWSLSHWYMWLPLWLYLAVVALAFVFWSVCLYRERRDNKLLISGAISLNEFRRRRGL